MEVKKYIVMVDDNFHYTDETKRYKYGEYDTPEKAIEVCKKIIENSIKFEKGATSDDFFSSYCMYGEDPFIIGDAVFSARDYAKEYCEELQKKNNSIF